MMRLALAFAVMAGGASAQSVKLSATEINILLSGNTAVGVWDDVPYRQYFDFEGMTVFVPEGATTMRGEWRVDADLNEFQSILHSDDTGKDAWEGWYVMEFSGDWYWVSKTTPPTPFEVLSGEQLVAQ